MEYLKVYASFRELITVLSEAETGRLFRAMLQYAAAGEEPANLFGNEKFVWPAGKREIDTIAMNDQKMRLLASQGGKAKARSRRQVNCSNDAGFILPDVSATNDSRSDAGDLLSVGRTEKEKRKENEEEKERNKVKEEEREKRKEKNIYLAYAFERFWAAYPRHVGKQAAWNSLRRLKPNEALLETMLKAIGICSRSAQWQEDAGRFIPHPTTWLNQQRWEDELPKVESVEKTVTAQEYHQRDYSSRQDWAMASFLEAVARMEAEEAMKDAGSTSPEEREATGDFLL